METKHLEIENLEKKLALIEQSPAVKVLLEEEAAKVLQLRREAAATVEKLDSEANGLLPALRAKVDDELEGLKQHDLKRKNLVDSVNRAKFALLQEVNRFDLERAAAQRVLLGNYDVEIDRAVLFFRDKWAEIQEKEVSRAQRLDGKNVFTMERRLTGFTNAPTLAAGARYCLEALKRLEEMKLEPEFDGEEIQALKDGLPNVEQCHEYSFGQKYLDLPSGTIRATTVDGKIYDMLKRAERLIHRR